VEESRAASIQEAPSLLSTWPENFPAVLLSRPVTSEAPVFRTGSEVGLSASLFGAWPESPGPRFCALECRRYLEYLVCTAPCDRPGKYLAISLHFQESFPLR